MYRNSTSHSSLKSRAFIHNVETTRPTGYPYVNS